MNGKKKAPSCARCKNHGVDSPVKGHKRHCMYKSCDCYKCALTQRHQKVVAAQVKYKRQSEQDGIMGYQTDDKSYSFESLVQICESDPNLAAKALIHYYGSLDKVVDRIIALKDHTDF